MIGLVPTTCVPANASSAPPLVSPRIKAALPRPTVRCPDLAELSPHSLPMGVDGLAPAAHVLLLLASAVVVFTIAHQLRHGSHELVHCRAGRRGRTGGGT